MQPAGTIGSQPWMTAPETVRVLSALTAEGAEVRFVGGCVRDAVLGRPATDVDIATHLPPEEVMRLLEANGVKAIPTGLAHGTVTAVVGDAHFEITTLRRDVETYGRRAKVAFTNDWAADAARRDFTINAMFAAPDGTLYDNFGGLADLRAGRVRFVGEPEERIREDVLRLLRFFRFQAHYGREPPQEAALDACARLAPSLPSLSGERIAGEMFRLLAAPEPAGMLRLMAERGILAHLLPQATAFDRLQALVALEGPEAGADPQRRLAALVVGGAPAAEAVADRLRLSNEERERLTALAEPAARLDPRMPARERRRWLYRLGRARYRDLALIASAEAGTRGRRDRRAWRGLIGLAEAWGAPAFPLRGRDAVALGVAAGPEVGSLLAELEKWWIDGDFAAGRAACLAELERRVATRSG